MTLVVSSGCAQKNTTRRNDEARIRNEQRAQNEKMLSQARQQEGKRALEERRTAEARAKEESQRAANERKLADARGKEQQRAAARQAEMDRRAADARAREERKLADARAKDEAKRAEERAKQQAKADSEARKRQKEKDKQFMPDEADMHTMDAFAQAVTASGARDDGMLFDNHFDGSQLNSAGQTKLTLMMQNRPNAQDTATIYLSLPEKDKYASARRTAVEQYLQQSGIGTNFQIKEGDNPDMRTPSSRGLMTYIKTDSDHQGAAGTGTSSDTNAPGVSQGTAK
jgi:hypothetical protein